MGIINLLNKLRGIEEKSDAERLKDTSIRNEVITSLVKIKYDLSKSDQLGINEHINQHTFKLENVEPDLKAMNIITKKLNEKGASAKLGSAEYYQAMIGSRYDVNLTVKTMTNKDAGFKEILDEIVDNYLIELGVSLDIVKQEFDAKYGISYKNIINNIKTEVKEEEYHPKKMKI
jgi:hypothetical protein